MNRKNTVYRVARTRNELEAGFALVYKEYCLKGYIPKGYKSRLRLSLYNALPTTTSFVAMQGKKVMANVTLIPDSPIGIPMDKLYKKELDSLREKRRKIAEVSQLSIDTKLFGKGFFSMFNFNKLIFIFRLFKLVLDYALNVDGITDFCIAVNPKQQYLYKFLLFEQIGPLRHYGLVNRAPALAFRLNVEKSKDKAKHRTALYKIFFGKNTDPALLSGKFKFESEDLKYFFVKKSNVFKKATTEQLAYIKSCYRGKKIDRIISL